MPAFILVSVSVYFFYDVRMREKARHFGVRKMKPLFKCGSHYWRDHFPSDRAIASINNIRYVEV